MAKYTEKADKKADAKLTKGLSPAQKKTFKAADAKHPKVKTMAADKKIDKKIISKITKKGK